MGTLTWGMESCRNFTKSIVIGWKLLETLIQKLVQWRVHSLVFLLFRRSSGRLTATLSSFIIVSLVVLDIMCNCLNYGLLLILCVGLSRANSEYSELLSSGTTVEKTLRSVGWKVDELSRLDRAGRQLTVELQCLIDQVNRGQSDSTILNRIHCVCESATSFLKGNCCLFICIHIFVVHHITYGYM